MEKRDFLYEGKAKKIYNTDDPNKVITYFKDDATAFNAEKKGSIADKGVINAAMSAALFKMLEGEGVKTHFCELLNERDLLADKVDIIKIEVIVRNVAAGSICKRLGLEKGKEISPPLVEWFYKDDDLGDPLITTDHVYMLGLASEDELKHLRSEALIVNDLLTKVFDRVGIRLVDFKIEFGRKSDGSIVLADEISPDTCRLWDKESGKSLDKDRFRFDMGEVESAYQEVMSRIGGVL
jgi:phosphoribosylaminoimidazole-succinocarboxamide synthase